MGPCCSGLEDATWSTGSDLWLWEATLHVEARTCPRRSRDNFGDANRRRGMQNIIDAREPLKVAKHVITM